MATECFHPAIDNKEGQMLLLYIKGYVFRTGPVLQCPGHGRHAVVVELENPYVAV